MNGQQEEAQRLIQACMATLRVPQELLWELCSQTAHTTVPIGVQVKLQRYAPFLPELIRSYHFKAKREQDLLASLYFVTTPNPGPKLQATRSLGNDGGVADATPAPADSPPQAPIQTVSIPAPVPAFDQQHAANAMSAHEELVGALVAELEAAEAHVAHLKAKLRLMLHCNN